MLLSLTEKAATELLRLRTKHGLTANVCLRVAVVGANCSGFQYQLGFDQEADTEHDDVFELHGIRVAVDKQSARYLRGAVIDFYDGPEVQGFTIRNPNSPTGCSGDGCCT